MTMLVEHTCNVANVPPGARSGLFTPEARRGCIGSPLLPRSAQRHMCQAWRSGPHRALRSANQRNNSRHERVGSDYTTPCPARGYH